MCKKLEEECNKENPKGNLFTPEIIDIITPKARSFKDLRACDSISSDSEGNKNNYLLQNDNYADLSHLKSICIVMEFVDTDLNEILKHKIDFSEQHLLKILYTALCSLCFIHEANVIHRDLKSANILIHSDCNAKVCDFGLSRSLPQSCTDENSVNSLNLRYKL